MAHQPARTSVRRILQQLVVVLYDSARGGYVAARMAGTAFEDLVHRVNNLLGTIEIQADVAAAEGTLDAHRSALELILQSARRTAAELAELRSRHARGE